MRRCEAKEQGGTQCWRHAEIEYRGTDGIKRLCKLHHALLERAIAKLATLRALRTPEERIEVVS